MKNPAFTNGDDSASTEVGNGDRSVSCPSSQVSVTQGGSHSQSNISLCNNSFTWPCGPLMEPHNVGLQPWSFGTYSQLRSSLGTQF